MEESLLHHITIIQTHFEYNGQYGRMLCNGHHKLTSASKSTTQKKVKDNNSSTLCVLSKFLVRYLDKRGLQLQWDCKEEK